MSPAQGLPAGPGAPPALRVATLGALGVASRLRAPNGLTLRTGPFCARIRTRLPDVAAAVQRLYADFPLAADNEFIDFNVGVHSPWWRRGRHAQVRFDFEGQDPFNPLPGQQGFPLLEWGLNWCVSALCHQYLSLHAAVLERNGRALTIPAPSGSGKSTLCAALAFSGWRLLSDELALIRPADGLLQPLPRPISLKNQSIEVLRHFAPQAEVGSLVHDTSKGTVAHLKPPAAAVAAALLPAAPGWILLPRFAPGLPTALRPLDKADAFMHLVRNAFNYDVFGAQGFHMLAALVGASTCVAFEYGGDLAQATARLSTLANAGRIEA